MKTQPISMKERADALHLSGKWQEAMPLYARYLARHPADAGAWTNFGILLRKTKNYEQALLAQKRAFALDPHSGDMHNNLANILGDMGELEQSCALRLELIAKAPDSPDQIALVGRSMRIAGDLDRAITYLSKAVETYPDDAELRMQLAFSHLTAGNYAEGFAYYQARWEQAEITPPKVAKPKWAGEDIAGKTIMVFPEQGFGDCVLFARFIPWLASLGARVILLAKPQIAPMLAQIKGLDLLISDPADAPEFDVWTSMLDIPMHAFASGIGIPECTKLSLPDDSVSHAKRDVSPHQNLFKIGVVWSGSATYKGNDSRRFDHKHLLRLAAIDEVQCYSLYKGPYLDAFHRDGTSGLIVDLASSDRSFADSAAVIAEMDLIVTMDTAIAHIAGALGKPVWNLLHWDGFWLYGKGSTTTPWYPNMRLYRQPKPRDWDAVFDEVVSDLKSLMSSWKTPHG